MIKKILTAALSLMCIYLSGCSKTYDCFIAITIPSENHTTIAPGRHFSVRGEIDTDKELPEDVEMTITLINEEGETVRMVHQDQKENMNFYLDYEKLEYADASDPQKEKLLAVRPPELLVEDMNDPETSMYDATIKCYYDDEIFNAFFVSSSEVENGAVVEDHMHFTDENGNPYTALEEGNYTIHVSLKDHDGNLIADANKDITIAPHENLIIARFSPKASSDLVFRWAEETGYEFCADIFPGNTTVIGVDAEIVSMWHAVDIAIFDQGCSNMLVYNMTLTSASYSVEMAHLQVQHVINDPSRFKAYYYDIGEPVFNINGIEETGTITKMKEGDKLVITRMDTLENGTDNILDLTNTHVTSSQVNYNDSFTITEGNQIAFSGVLSPIQVEDSQIVFDEERNEYALDPDMGYVSYTIYNGNETKTIQKGIGLQRTYEDGSTSASVYEFYHVFSSEELKDAYKIGIKAYDSFDNEIEGSEETLLLN